MPLHILLEPAVQLRQILGLPENRTIPQVITPAQYRLVGSAVGPDTFSYWVSARAVEVRS